MAMKNLNFLRRLMQTSLILLVLGAGSVLMGADSNIGMAIANGSFQIDHSRVWWSSTLFDGSRVQSASATPEIRLNGGTKLRLASGTEMMVYQGRSILQSGFAQVDAAAPYEIEARSLHVSAGPDTVARVRLEGGRRLTVAAVRGGVRVANARGMLIALVNAGNSLDFEAQGEGAAAPARATGCLVAKSSKLLLIDQTTNLTFELWGTGLAEELGNRVTVVGTGENAAGGAHVLRVAELNRVSKGGCSAVAKKAGAATTAVAGAGAAAGAASAAGAGAATAGVAGAAGAATAAGIGAGTVAVIGGVAAAATVGGLAAVGDLPGQSEAPPTASR
jgi:hypothetical protein